MNFEQLMDQMTSTEEILCLCGWLAHDADFSQRAMDLYAEAEKVSEMRDQALLWSHYLKMELALMSQSSLQIS